MARRLAKGFIASMRKKPAGAFAPAGEVEPDVLIGLVESAAAKRDADIALGRLH